MPQPAARRDPHHPVTMSLPGTLRSKGQANRRRVRWHRRSSRLQRHCSATRIIRLARNGKRPPKGPMEGLNHKPRRCSATSHFLTCFRRRARLRCSLRERRQTPLIPGLGTWSCDLRHSRSTSPPCFRRSSRQATTERALSVRPKAASSQEQLERSSGDTSLLREGRWGSLKAYIRTTRSG